MSRADDILKRFHEKDDDEKETEPDILDKDDIEAVAMDKLMSFIEDSIAEGGEEIKPRFESGEFQISDKGRPYLSVVVDNVGKPKMFKIVLVEDKG